MPYVRPAMFARELQVFEGETKGICAHAALVLNPHPPHSIEACFVEIASFSTV